MLAEGIDVEMQAPAVRPGDLLFFQVDLQNGVGTALGIVHQQIDIALRELDRQDAVLETVVVENVGEAGGDDAVDAEIEERPRSMFAARAAAEILAGY